MRTVAEEKNERIFDDDDTDFDYVLEEDDEDFGRGEIAGLLENIRTYIKQRTSFIVEVSEDKNQCILIYRFSVVIGIETFRIQTKKN